MWHLEVCSLMENSCPRSSPPACFYRFHSLSFLSEEETTGRQKPRSVQNVSICTVNLLKTLKSTYRYPSLKNTIHVM